MTPDDRRYSTEHEWAKAEGGEVVVGITDFAQEQLGDVVYVELPSVGDQVKQGRVMGVVESVKAASDLYSPVSGEVVAVNDAAVGEPQKLNDAPYTDGWLIRVRPDNLDELNNLMTAEQYDLRVSDRGPEE
ncbi:MAG TPA: glycine cleavage system protein GcvH [Chloroflexota bacterium]|nr:glycine cleavage system protein GcvH [Chloroflexota bacterium]